MAIDAPPRVIVEQLPVSAESFPPASAIPEEQEPGLVWRRMSYAEFSRLPEKPKAEWFDGWAVIHVDMPKRPHAYAAKRLYDLLNQELPQLDVMQDWGFTVDGTEFRPDIIAFNPDAPDTDYLKVPPVLAVEVLSPSTRRYDLVTKAAKFLKLGVEQYWTVDPRIAEIIVRQRSEDQWQQLAIIDSDHPTATITVSDYGDVTLDHTSVFSAPKTSGTRG